MKNKIIEKLTNHAKSLLSKDSLAMDDVNFLIFWMNRLENQEAQAAYKENEEKLKAEQKEKDDAWKKTMQSMIDGIGR